MGVSLREKRRTRLGGKVYRPTEPRVVLDRIHAIIREGLQTAHKPLPAPPARIAEPRLFRKDHGALRGARIAPHARADGTCGLRERGQLSVQRRKEEREIGRRGRGWEAGVREREGVVRVRRFRCERRREEGRGEEEGLVCGRVAEEG
jgi:hypothetical protein